MKLKKVGIIGVGFMGASLALAIKGVFPRVSVWGYARSKRSFDKLKRLNILNKVTTNLEELLENSDVVILATPVSVILDHLKRIGPLLKSGAFVVDLGSTKCLIERAAKKYLPKNVNFVGSHPLCGSNKFGPENAKKDLYKGSICIVTSRDRASRFIKKFWEKLGCKVFYFKASVHDQMLSCISHLPHIISYSLAYSVPEEYFKFISSSFRDLTRISSSPGQVWVDIFLSNRENITKSMKGYIKTLEIFKELIRNRDRKKLLEIIERINVRQEKYQQ